MTKQKYNKTVENTIETNPDKGIGLIRNKELSRLLANIDNQDYDEKKRRLEIEGQLKNDDKIYDPNENESFRRILISEEIGKIAAQGAIKDNPEALIMSANAHANGLPIPKEHDLNIIAGTAGATAQQSYQELLDHQDTLHQDVQENVFVPENYPK